MIYTERDSSFELNLEGYSEIAFVDLIQKDTESPTDLYFDTIDITAGSTSTGTPTYDNNTFNFYCNINFNVTMDFALPNFLSKPRPNLTLFTKADEFSYEISRLNDTLIQVFQQMGCCNISDEYNKTVVPIFRYLASSKEHTDCGLSPNLAPDSCGGDSNFMKEILGIVRDITKVYTAIEPLFCLISPIPGNPWLPVDFNWMAPILPYIQSFQQMMDKIMSGSLFDIIIKPIKELNNKIINCTQVKSQRSISVSSRETSQKDSEELIKIMKDLKDQEILSNSLVLTNSNNQPAVLTLKEKIESETQNFVAKQELQQSLYETLQKYAPINNIPKANDVEANKLAEIRNPGQGICRCLLRMANLEIKLPKFPKAEIRILPTSLKLIDNIYNNDLLKYTDETAYDITLGEVLDTTSSTENLTFSKNLITDFNFIEKFKGYMDKTGSRSFYIDTEVLTQLDNTISPTTIEITTEKFIEIYRGLLPDFQFAYTDKSEYIKETINTINTCITPTWNGINLNIPETGSGLPSTILNTNKILIAKINEIQRYENQYIGQLDAIKKNDYVNWKTYKEQADNIMKRLNTNLDLTDYFDLTEYDLGLDRLRQQQMYLDFFGTYLDIDINTDFFDNRLYEKLMFYSDIAQTSIYNICLEYVAARKEVTYFDEISGDNYKAYASTQIELVASKIKTLIQRYNLTYEFAINTDYSNEGELANILLTFESLEDFENYLNDLKDITNNPFGQYFLNTLLDNYKYLIYKSIKGTYIFDVSYNTLIEDTKNKLITNLPTITISGQQYNYIYYSIKILQCESYKLTLFEVLNKNIAFDFYLTDYPEIDCGCDTIVCQLIRMVMDFILYYVNMFLGWLLQLMLDWLIPKWLRALIDLIIYKLKCVMEIVYMKDTMSLIDRVYENFLNNLKTRVNNYPYENCANNAIEAALHQITDNYNEENGTDVTLTYNDTEKELKNHIVNVDFVDINKRPITNTTMDQWVTVNIKVTYDIGAKIQSILLSDKTILGDSSSTELVNQNTNVYRDQNIYVVDIPLDKIISGKLQVLVKSYKSFADETIKYDTAEITILNYIDNNTMRFLLSDYQTSDYEIFLEKNKETLLVSFSILNVDALGDPTQNLFLIKNYIDNIILYDKAPEGITPLPSIILQDDDLVTSTHYSEESGLFNIIIDCSNFFPSFRNIYGVINTKPVYSSISLNAKDQIYCQAEDSTMDPTTGTIIDSGPTGGTFNDTIIYSNLVKIPNSINQTEEDILQNNIQVRQNTPLIFDCTLTNGEGTSLNIISLNNELHDVWVNLGLI